MPATLAALQRGDNVTYTRLVKMTFASGSMYVHKGIGKLVTGDGITWQGVGSLGRIGDIDRSVLSRSASPTIGLSGVNADLVAKTLASPEQVKGRPAVIYEQYFDSALQILDLPVALFAGIMDTMVISDQGETATITVTLLSPLYRVKRAAFGYLNQASQSRLFPGDAGLRDVQKLVMRNRTWPESSS